MSESLKVFLSALYAQRLSLYALCPALIIIRPVCQSACHGISYPDNLYKTIFSIGITRIPCAPASFSLSITSQKSVSLITE